MILVKPSAELYDITPNALKKIEDAGRVCYQSEGDCPEEFVKRLIKRGHLSVLRHVEASFKLIVDRGISHQLVRHGLAKFSQESTRYVNGKKHGVYFVIPPWLDIETSEYEEKDYMGGGDWIFDFIDHNGEKKDTYSFSEIENAWLNAMNNASFAYLDLLDSGWTPEQARSVLPNSTKTELFVTTNMEHWRHILKTRLNKAAHPQMIEIMYMILDKFRQSEVSIIFEDIDF